jgi:hypothetical protein
LNAAATPDSSSGTSRKPTRSDCSAAIISDCRRRIRNARAYSTKFLFRAGYTDEDKAKGKLRHAFYHIGATLVELVEQEDGVSYPGHTNPKGRPVSSRSPRT